MGESEERPGDDVLGEGAAGDDGMRRDALGFVRETLGESPYRKQVEILRAAERSRRVSVVGCNGSGKDWAAARAVLWWVHAKSPAKAIVTGPTMRQVEDIVWREIRTAYDGAREKLPGRMYRSPRYEINDSTFALGVSTNSPFNLQGFHSPNLMALITEAHAVREGEIDAVRRLNPALLLMTGNPFTSTGSFFDSHHSRRHLYETVQISAFDTPNLQDEEDGVPGMITREDVEDRKAEWGEESPMYVGSVLGQFPENLDEVMVSLTKATAAAQRRLRAEGPVILGCDVARKGMDRTVVTRRQGSVARIIRKVTGHDTMQTAGFLMRRCELERVDLVVVDDTGLGAGVTDRLKELGLRGARLLPFMGGETANDKRHFANRAAEAWWRMRQAYVDGDLDTDDDTDLISQVSSRRYWIRSDGKIRLESKEDLYRSPDEADSLAMTFAETRYGGLKLWT